MVVYDALSFCLGVLRWGGLGKLFGLAAVCGPDFAPLHPFVSMCCALVSSVISYSALLSSFGL